jgi:hypothetical protein
VARLASLIIVLLLAGCASQDFGPRISAAAKQQGQAQARQTWNHLPPACTDKMGRVPWRSTEPWVVYKKRVDASTDARDARAEDCSAYDADMAAGKEVR